MWFRTPSKTASCLAVDLLRLKMQSNNEDSEALHPDINLESGGNRFGCHKAILVARSDVFRTLLSHDDIKETRKGAIIIDDFGPGMHVHLYKYVIT